MVDRKDQIILRKEKEDLEHLVSLLESVLKEADGSSRVLERSFRDLRLNRRQRWSEFLELEVRLQQALIKMREA